MAEKIKDEQDRILDSLFESEPLADDGFSAAIVLKVKRRLWLRRLLLPSAALVGASIAAKPVSELLGAVKGIAALIPDGIFSSSTGAIPQLPMVVLGAMLLAVCMLGARVLQE